MMKPDGNGPDRPGQTPDPEMLFREAMAARKAGELTVAARLLDDVLRILPRAKPALHARARIALQRAEPDALTRFDAAIGVDPGNADLHLGKAEALGLIGDHRGARIVAEQIATQAPGFIEGLVFLSGLYLAAGEADFTAPFKQAARRAPQDPNIAAAHCDALAGLDFAERAMEVAAEARLRFAQEPYFALIEAQHAGSAGDWARAEAIFADLTIDSPDRWLAEARHKVRAHDAAAAQQLLGKVLAANAGDIGAWALQGLVWRMADGADDKAREREKAQWLHEQAGLVQMRPLIARAGLLDEVRAVLDRLHGASAMPLGQSLRGGSQTRGILFHRTEPVLGELREAIAATLEAYRADLPAPDPAHPLLRHRAQAWSLAGSWSVKLSGGGDFHAAHIHPSGIISSALYIGLPEGLDHSDRPSWLELGRPPKDLALELEPVQVIRPQTGHLALFPSTLYHGTRPFGATEPKAAAERMTVAFDVVPAPN